MSKGQSSSSNCTSWKSRSYCYRSSRSSIHLASAPCIGGQARPQRRFSAPFFCVSPMLVNADRGTVDHLEVALVSGRNCFVNSVPDAQFPPPHEAVVAGRRRTIALRYVGPGRSRAQAPENPVQHLAIIHPWLAARLVRQQRLNDRPFKISDLVAASAHHISSFEELESHHPEPRYQFMSLRPSPDISHKEGASGLCLSDNGFKTKTYRSTEAVPDADTV